MYSPTNVRTWFCSLAAIGVLLLPAIAHAQGVAGPCSGEDSICSYGPCDCAARKTLFQWSYGTTFGGGPSSWDEPLVSDRPDFTEASVTVGRGVRQLEMGWTYTQDSDNGPTVRSHTYPETLLRVGMLADWFELRLFWSYEQERIAGNTMSGSQDLNIGTKIALTPQEGFLPEMAVIAQMAVPTGSAAFGDNEVLPGVVWLYSWELADWVSTGGQSGLIRALDSGTNQPYGEFIQSWTVAYSLTDQLGAYTEWFAIVPDGADTERTTHFFDGGFTYLVTNNLQLDIRGGVGLNQAADDFFVGSGAVVRF